MPLLSLMSLDQRLCTGSCVVGHAVDGMGSEKQIGEAGQHSAASKQGTIARAYGNYITTALHLPGINMVRSRNPIATAIRNPQRALLQGSKLTGKVLHNCSGDRHIT